MANPITLRVALDYADRALGGPRWWPPGTYSTLLEIHAEQILAAAERAYQAGRRDGLKQAVWDPDSSTAPSGRRPSGSASG